jgi:hypothetical protein
VALLVSWGHAASVVSLSALWRYQPHAMSYPHAGSSGSWWGGTLAITPRGNIMAGAKAMLPCTEPSCPPPGGQTQVLLKRSVDGGLSWSNSTVLMPDAFCGGSFIVGKDAVILVHLGSAWKVAILVYSAWCPH